MNTVNGSKSGSKSKTGRRGLGAFVVRCKGGVPEFIPARFKRRNGGSQVSSLAVVLTSLNSNDSILKAVRQLC